MKKKLKDSFDRGFSVGLRSLEDYKRSNYYESSPYDEYCGSDRKELPIQFDKYGTEKSCFEKGKRTGQKEAQRFRRILKEGKNYEGKKEDDDFWADSSPEYENAFLRGVAHGYSIPIPKNYEKTHDEITVYCGKRNVHANMDSFPKGFSSMPGEDFCFEKGVDLAIQMRLYRMHNKAPTPNRILTDDERRKINQTWPKGSESIIKDSSSYQMPTNEKRSSRSSPKIPTNISLRLFPKKKRRSSKIPSTIPIPSTISRKKTPTIPIPSTISRKKTPTISRKKTPMIPSIINKSTYEKRNSKISPKISLRLFSKKKRRSSKKTSRISPTQTSKQKPAVSRRLSSKNMRRSGNRNKYQRSGSTSPFKRFRKIRTFS